MSLLAVLSLIGALIILVLAIIAGRLVYKVIQLNKKRARQLADIEAAGQAAQMAEQRASAERQRRFDALEERAKADSQKLIDMACRAIKDARSGNATASAADWEKDC